MKLLLPNSVLSPQDLEALTFEIREYASWFSHNTIKHQAGASRGTKAPELTAAALEVLRNWNAQKLLDQATLAELGAALEDFKASAPSLTITLAAPAGGDLKQTLVTWCRENIAPNVLISFRFNATLLGGMVVRYGSHIFDWSFRREILEHHAKFPEVLRRV